MAKDWLPPTVGSKIILACVVAFFVAVGGFLIWQEVDAASVQSGVVVGKEYTPEKRKRDSDGKVKVEREEWKLRVRDAKDSNHVVTITVTREEYERYDVGDDWKRS